MANNVNNVSFGKPKVGGAIWVAPLGTELPTDAKSALDEGFKSLGYISDDGLKNNQKRDSEDIKAWGGDQVLKVVKGLTDEFSFTLIESLNVEVLKAVFGAENVTGTLDTGVSVKVNGKELASLSWVVETIGRGGVLRRMVIPNGKGIVDGDITFKDDEAVGYEMTVSAMPDGNGNTHYEYVVKGAE